MWAIQSGVNRKYFFIVNKKHSNQVDMLQLYVPEYVEIHKSLCPMYSNKTNGNRTQFVQWTIENVKFVRGSGTISHFESNQSNGFSYKSVRI